MSSYDDFSRWGVSNLKKYLRDRGLKTSGKKIELVALAFSASQLGVTSKPSVATDNVKNSEDYASLLVTTTKDLLPDPIAELKHGWIGEQNGLSQWPPCMYFDIAQYLMSQEDLIDGAEETLKRQLMTDYKEGKAYSYFDSKWLGEIFYHPINEQNKYCFLKAQCTPSQKVHNPPHTAWVCLEKRSGTIQKAYCTCFAG